MKQAYSEFQALRSSWDSLRKTRPNETDFEPYGLKNGKAEDFDALFESWDEAISKAASSTKSTGPDEQAIEALVTHLIGKVVQQLNAAPSNGYSWLFSQSPFLGALAELNAAIVPVIDRRFSVRKKVIEAAKNELFGGITRIEGAAPVADKLLEQQARISEQADSIEEALSAAESAAKDTSASSETATERLAEIQEILESAQSSKVEYEATVADAVSALDDAKAALANVEATQKSADDGLKKGDELVKIANEKLSKAIADVNRQGMAGAYETSAKKLGRERMLWLSGFAVAIVYLVLVACGFLDANEGNPVAAVIDAGKNAAQSTGVLADIPYWQKLLQVLPLAAPGIWLGWFCAKNASLVGRAQQDYTFKMSAALAFEAHRKEIVATNNDDLLKSLIETTIRNFGENPVRLYNGKDAQGHPLESLRGVFSDKEHFEKLVKLLEALKPSK